MAGAGRDLEKELEAFLERHPGGWEHEDWKGLIAHLEREGYPIEDQDTLGLHLERLALGRSLEELGVSGVGPRRKDALVERFQTRWAFRRAGVDEIAALPSIPRALAERIAAARD